MKIRCNIRSVKRCAFCRFWYDPTNAYINPIAPKVGLWEYESSAKCKCLKSTSLERAAGHMCGQYECKLTGD